MPSRKTAKPKSPLGSPAKSGRVRARPPRPQSPRSRTPRSRSHPFAFHGDGGTLFGIHIVNLFLTFITCGVYLFWAKVKVRKYVWGQVSFEGDRFSYHGTAQEILLGWLKAAAIFGVPYLLLREGPAWMGLPVPLVLMGALLSLLLLLCFIPVAVVGSRRYRLSRTAWRGIRFSFHGRAREFAGLFAASVLYHLLTLGFYAPYWAAAKHRFLVGHSFLGGRRFHFDGKGEDLFGSYVAAVLLALPTLGLSLVWYGVFQSRYVWNHTCFGKARFKSTVEFGDYFVLNFTNFFLVLLTLGFGTAWAQVRSYRFHAGRLFLEGDAGLNRIGQEASAAEASGEELSSLLDLDFDLG